MQTQASLSTGNPKNREPPKDTGPTVLSVGFGGSEWEARFAAQVQRNLRRRFRGLQERNTKDRRQTDPGSGARPKNGSALLLSRTVVWRLFGPVDALSVSGEPCS
jgi:hypothetical protein